MKALKPSAQIAKPSPHLVIPKARLTPTPAGARPSAWYQPPAPRVRPPVRAHASREAALLRKRGLYVGRNRETDLHQYLDPAYLATHLHVLGRTGVGKTMFLAWLFRLLAQMRDYTIILLDPKGDLYDLAKQCAIADGLTKRLVCFDPADPDCGGFNPLRPNGLPEFTHAKAVREAIRSAWGQADFFQTPQLARFLFLALAVARMMEFDLVQALQMLRPGPSALRKRVLPKLQDPYVRESLQYLDGLPERRQEELVAPCLARLEAFVLDPMIRHLLTRRTRVLDLAEVIEQRQICLISLARYQPLRADDVGLLGKLLVNDILVKVFERPKEKRLPVILMADEVQNFATFDFCRILDEGRGLKLWCMLAHQHLAQLMDEERSGYLSHSIMADARTKVLFNALPEDVEALSKQVFLDGRWHPWMIKDELDSLEQQFCEERRTSRTTGQSGSRGRSLTHSEQCSEADSLAETDGRNWQTSVGGQESWGVGQQQGQSVTHTRGRADTLTLGASQTDTAGVSHTTSNGEVLSNMESISDTEGWSEGAGWARSHGEGSTDADASGVTRTWDREHLFSPLPSQYARSAQHTAGRSEHQAATESGSRSHSGARSVTHAEGTSLQHSESDTISQSHATTYSASQARTDSASDAHTRSSSVSQTHERGVTWSASEGGSLARTQGHTTTMSRGVARGMSEQEGWNAGEIDAPFLAPYGRRVPSSRTYLTWEEHTLVCTALASGQDKGQCIIKLPLKPLLFLDAPWWEAPFVTRRMLVRADERIRDNLPADVLPPAAATGASPAAIDVTPLPVPAAPHDVPPHASGRPNFWS